MIVTFRGPQWFYGIDVLIEIILTLIILGLVIYGYKAFKLTRQKKYFYFFLGFLVIALDFIIHSVTNTYIYYHIMRFNYCSLSCHLDTMLHLFSGCMLVYAIMNLFAYFLLSLMYVKFKNKTKILFILFAIFSGILFFKQYLYNVFALMFLLPVIYYAYKNYKLSKNLNSKLVVMAFSFIALAHVFFLVEMKYIYFYVVGMLSLFTGYLMLLYLLRLVKKNDKKR